MKELGMFMRVRRLLAVGSLVAAALLALACERKPTSDGASDAGAAAAGDGGSKAALVERGRYLATHVVICVNCHTPRVRGALDMTRFMAGAPCFVGTPRDPNAPPPVPGSGKPPYDYPDGGVGEPDYKTFGCLTTPNLTNHDTGLKNYSDAQIKNMIVNGVRPDGSFLHPVMFYWGFHNLTAGDADAIVAFLRSLPGIHQTIPPSDKPWIDQRAKKLAFIDGSKIWKPAAGAPNYDSLMRGRYLATLACMDCHSPIHSAIRHGIATDMPGLDESRLFAGGGFPWISAVNGMPVPPFPREIWSSNLTSHATGLVGYSVDDLKKAIRSGVAKDGSMICPPMPSGKAGFEGMSDQDATDIANYILALPPIANARPADCKAPGPGGPPSGPPSGAPSQRPAPSTGRP